MALKYTTTASINAYLGTSGIDALITQLAEGAEALFDTLVGDGIESKVRTDYFDIGYYRQNPCNEGRVFYLQSINPTAVTSVNGVSAGTIDVNYSLIGSKLELQYPVSMPTAFPYKYKVIYTAGYATIPNDVILAINTIVGAIYNTRNSNGIASFKQDLLSVNFKDASILDTIVDSNTKGMIQAIVTKYTVHTVLS